MNRRTLLSTALASPALALAAAAPAQAQATATFRLITDRPNDAAALAARVSAVSGGRIAIAVEAAPADATMIDAVASGAADMCLAPCDAFTDRIPAFGLFAAMPFGMSSAELEAWVLASDGQRMWDGIADQFGLRFTFAGDDGPAPLWSKQPIGDVAGLSTGSTGLCQLSMAALGAQVVDVRSPEVAASALDLIEGLGPQQMVDAGLAGAFRHVSLANPNRPSGLVALGMNPSRLGALADADRFAFERAVMAYHAKIRSKRYHDDALALGTIDAAVTPLPDSLWASMRSAAENVLTTVFESGPAAAAAVDSYIYFMAEVSIWSEIGEAAYYTGRKQVAAL